MKTLLSILPILFFACPVFGGAEIFLSADQTVGGGGANYQVATCYAYVADTNASGENIQIAIYGPTGTKLADSAPTAIGTTGFPKWVATTVTSGPTLSANTNYYIGVAGDGYINMRAKASPGWVTKVAARGAWPSTATAINPTTDTESGSPEIGLYCANSTGTLLIGNSTSANFTTVNAQDSSADTRYYSAGYTLQ